MSLYVLSGYLNADVLNLISNYLLDYSIFFKELKNDVDMLNRLKYVNKNLWMYSTFTLIEDCCKHGKVSLLYRLHRNKFIGAVTYVDSSLKDMDVYSLNYKYKLRLFYFALVNKHWDIYHALYKLGYYRMEPIPKILDMRIN